MAIDAAQQTSFTNLAVIDPPDCINCSICGEAFEILAIAVHYERHVRELESMIGRKPDFDVRPIVAPDDTSDTGNRLR